MTLKQSVNLLLIALFVLAFQSTTIHFQHHVIDEMSECNLCHTSKQLDLYKHNSSTIVVNDNLAVKTRNREEKIVVKSKFDYTDTQQLKRVDIVKYRLYTVKPIPLGYFSTAPPTIFS
jgi:exonuclease I